MKTLQYLLHSKWYSQWPSVVNERKLTLLNVDKKLMATAISEYTVCDVFSSGYLKCLFQVPLALEVECTIIPNDWLLQWVVILQRFQVVLPMGIAKRFDSNPSDESKYPSKYCIHFSLWSSGLGWPPSFQLYSLVKHTQGPSAELSGYQGTAFSIGFLHMTGWHVL